MFYNSSVLKKPSYSKSADGTDSILTSRLFMRVGDCLGDILKVEARRKNPKPIFTVKSVAALALLKSDFETQLRTYARSKEPFTQPMRPGMTALQWWKNLQQYEEASVLAVTFTILCQHLSDNFFRLLL